MKARKPIKSQMGWSTADKIVVRGHDLPNELIGHIDLGGMAFLEIMGRRPSVQEAEVFNALLVTLVEHGMTPQAIATRMINAAAPEALQAAVAAGLCGVGSVFAGGSEQCAKILQEALSDGKDAGNLDKIAAGIVESFVLRKGVIPGIGHPVHKPIDPRTPVLFAIVLCELGFPWRICRGIVVISRAVGLVGHIAEEMRNPIALEIWARTEAEVYENKD